MKTRKEILNRRGWGRRQISYKFADIICQKALKITKLFIKMCIRLHLQSCITISITISAYNQNK